MVQAWRLTSLFDDEIKYELIYNGNEYNLYVFVKNYIKKIKMIYPYYDRIYIVEYKEDIDDMDDYIDVLVYKNELNKNRTIIEKLYIYFKNSFNYCCC